MKMKINFIIFSLVLIGFCFCKSASTEVIDKIIAIVNDDIITLSQLKKEASSYIKQIESSDYSDQEKKEQSRRMNEKVFNALIDRSLTTQEAKMYHIAVSDNEVNNAIENIIKTKSVGKEEFKKALLQEGLTLEEFRENIKNQILQSKLITHAVKSKVVITESDIKKYYKENTIKYLGKKKVSSKKFPYE